MTRNHIALKQFSLLWNHYAFIDVPAYLADQLFIQHKVTVHFGKEMGRKDSEYRIIFCKVRKKDSERFLGALEELPQKMLICGHLDYEEYCDEFFRKYENYVARKERAALKAEQEGAARASYSWTRRLERYHPGNPCSAGQNKVQPEETGKQEAE